MTWKHFPYYWHFVRGIQRGPVDSPHKGSVMWRFDILFAVGCSAVDSRVAVVFIIWSHFILLLYGPSYMFRGIVSTFLAGHSDKDAWLGVRNVIFHTQKPWFNIKMSSYQCRKFHCGDKTVVKSSYLRNGISFTDRTTSLHYIRTQDPNKDLYGWLSISMWSGIFMKTPSTKLSGVVDTQREILLFTEGPDGYCS